MKKHENVCKNHNYCCIEMPKKEIILKYNHGEKSMKPIICADMDSLLEKTDTGKYKDAFHSVCNLTYKTPKKFPVVFYNGSKYGYHFINKEPAEGFKGQLECLGGNEEKSMTFWVTICKEFKNGKTITYKMKFFDSFRFVSDSLSRLVDNLSEGLHKNKCKDW